MAAISAMRSMVVVVALNVVVVVSTSDVGEAVEVVEVDEGAVAGVFDVVVHAVTTRPQTRTMQATRNNTVLPRYGTETSVQGVPRGCFPDQRFRGAVPR